MKHIFITLAVALFAFSFTSCERESSLRIDGKVKVNCIVKHSTKSTLEASKDRIRVLDVLVFMAETGDLISHDRISSADISLYLQRGILHHCCFFVNAPEDAFADITNYDQIGQKLSELADNADEFVMQNMTSRMFVSDGNLEVNVSRLCSKISVDAVEPKFMDSSISQSKVVLKRMFLMNVASTIGYDEKIYPAAEKYNVTGYDSSLPEDIKSLIMCEYDYEIKNNDSIVLDSSLYCYSGDIDDSSLSATKLVLELDIAGSPNYYSVAFPKIKPNHEYHIESIRLLGFGSGIPGDIFDRTEVNLVVTVNPWGSTEKDQVMN